ncbi:hypothetical protein Tco_0897078, partial [Tanacetum coccineum]
MLTLHFAETYNMMAFLEKPAEIDKKKVIITETSIRSDLHLEDAGGIDCLPTATIFEELARMGEGKDFSGRVTPLFATMMVQANQEEGVDSGIPIDSQQILITTQPSSSRPQKKQSRRKQRKETEVPQDETHHDDSIPIPSNDPLLSSEDRMQLTELIWRRQRMLKQRRLLVDASKQGRIFEDFDKDNQVSLVDETQERSNDAEMFDTDNIHGDEVIMDMAVGEKQEQSAKVDEREVSTSVEDSAATTILVTNADEGVTATKIDEITTNIAQATAIEEKDKNKANTTKPSMKMKSVKKVKFNESQ